MEEYLDIFDENNIPTGEKALRSIVHAQGLWHRTMHIYVFREKENGFEFLVHLRSKTKDTAPNMWAKSFGGHIEAGKTLEEATKKELQEEIGLEIADFKSLIEKEWSQGGTFPNFEHIKTYYYRDDGETDSLKFNDGEVQEVRWMNSEDIKKAMKEEPEKWSGSGQEGFTKTINFLTEKLKDL